MKKSKFLLLFIMICCTALSFSVFAVEADEVLSVGSITIEGEKLCFDIAISNEDISYESAYTVVSVYDKYGGMLETSNELVTYDEKQVTVDVSADFDIRSYQVMLLSSDGKLKPLCASVKEKIDLNKLLAEMEATFQKDVQLLSAMDIINVNGLENASSTHSVTRAEFAAVLCRTMGYGSQEAAFKGEDVFGDVSSEHPNAGYINFLAQSGIIEGTSEGIFSPDDAIAYEDAVKAFVYAAGYKPMESVMGDYKKIARDTGITSGITSQEFVSMKTLATLTQNVLSVPKLEATSYGSPDEVDWEIMDGKGGRDYATLLTEKDLYIATGIVADFYGGYAVVTITEDSADYEFEEEDDIEFIIGSSDIKDYLFCNVDIYAKKLSRREYEILEVKPSAKSKTLNIKSEDVTKVIDNSLEYCADGIKASINMDISQIIYNHSYSYYDIDEVVAMDDVHLKFIENTGDKRYDVLVAEKYTYACVDEVDAQEGKIKLNGTDAYLDFEDEDVTIDLVNFAGQKLALGDFAVGDVVAYISDDPSFENDYNYLKIVNLYDNIVTGTIKEAGDTYVVLSDGNRYENPFEYELELGLEYALYISFSNRIAHATAVSDIPQRPEKQPEDEPEQNIEEPSRYKDNVELLSKLDIININGLEKVPPEHKVTKAEFAATLVRIKGYNKETELFRNENIFSDVTSDHWAAGYINFAAKKNIFSSNEGEFCPDEPITYIEALRGAVNFLGYAPMASIWGNNPVAYVRVASKQGMTDGLKPDVYVTSETLAALGANLIKTPLMVITEIVGEEISWEIMDGKKGREYKTPLTEMDIYVATGVVVVIDVDCITFHITKDSDDFEFEEDDICEFEINDSNIADYQFQNVDVYVKKNVKKDYEVVAVDSGKIGGVFTISSDYINPVDDRMVEYYVDFHNSSETKSIKIDLDAFIYNKMFMDTYDFMDVLDDNDVELKFIENTGDTQYDALIATHYDYEVLEFVDPAKGKMTLGGRTVIFDFEDDEKIYVFRDDAGRKLTLDDFRENDIVAFYGDSNRISDADYIEVVKITEDTVTGTVEEMRVFGDYDYIMVDGKYYANNSGVDYQFGETYKFFIGLTGKVVYGTTDLSFGEDGSEGGDNDGDDNDGDDSGDEEEIPVLPQKIAYADNVALLADTDIINVNGLENAQPDHEITNGELAAVVVKMLNLEADLMSKAEASLMASSGHWAEPYISLLRELNIIGSADSFLPDDKPTYIVTLKTLVRALGYEPLVKTMGGTDAEYVDVANSCGLVSGVEVTTGVTADTFAALVANGVNVPVMKVTRIEGGNPVWEIMDGKGTHGYENLLTAKNVYVVDGVFVCIEGKYAGFIVTNDSKDYEFEESEEYDFLMGDTNIAEYILQNVRVYVEKGADRTYKVISVSRGDYGSILELISNDVLYANNSRLEYYIDRSNSSATKEIKIDIRTLVFNNVVQSYGGMALEDIIYGDCVELKFIENTGDTIYDAVIATKYIDGIVDVVDADNNTIIIYGETVKLDTANEEITVILCDDKGNKLTLSDFERNDVVAVVSDIAGAYDYAYNDYIKIVKNTKEPVTGVVEETYESNGEGYAVINGTEYLDTWGDFVVGDEGTFYINKYNHIISFKPNYTYGYILESAVSEAAFSEDTWQVKILTEDNDVIICDLADVAEYEYKEIYGGVIQWDDSGEIGANFDAKRLITYKINSKGKLGRFDPIAYDGWQTFTGEYSQTLNTIGGNYLEKDTAVFAIGSADCDYLYSAGVDDLTDGMTYTGAFCADNRGRISALVITSGDVMGSSKYNESKYGYILEGAYESGAFSDGWVLRLLSKDEGIVDLSVLSRAGDEIDAQFPDGYIEWTEGAFNNYGLIEYKTNIGGYITSVEFAKNNGTLKSIANKQYDAGTQTIGGVTLEEDAAVFVINSDSVRDAQVSDISCLKDEGVYSGIVLRDAKGDYVAFVVTKGEVGEIMYPGDEKCYGYILETVVEESAFDHLWYARIHKSNGKIAEYVLSEGASAYYESVYDGEEFAIESDTLSSDRLVSYIVDKDGVIRTFNRMADGKGTSFESVSGKFIGDTMTLGGEVIDKNAVVYYIAEMYDGYTTVVGTDYFEDGEEYAGAVYTDENGKCTVVIITEGNGVFNNTAGFAVVEKIIVTKDANDNDVTKVLYVRNEEEGSIIFDEESESYVHGFDIWDFMVGTAFMFSANAEGVVNEYIPIATIEDYPGRAVLVSDELNEMFDNDTQIIGGYIANENKKSTSRGEIITICTYDGEMIDVLVTDKSNKYTYNDSGRNTVIEIGDFLAEDAYYLTDYGDGFEYTPVVVKIVDDEATDIYTSNQRQWMDYN